MTQINPQVPLAENFAAVTLDTDYPNPILQLLVQDGGNVEVLDINGHDTTISSVPAWSMIPGPFKQVKSAGTTSTNLFCWY